MNAFSKMNDQNELILKWAHFFHSEPERPLRFRKKLKYEGCSCCLLNILCLKALIYKVKRQKALFGLEVASWTLKFLEILRLAQEWSKSPFLSQVVLIMNKDELKHVSLSWLLINMNVMIILGKFPAVWMLISCV
jgi:hypothetical protein